MKKLLKQSRNVLALALMVSAAHAQTANVSQTDITTSGVNLSASPSTVPSTTLYFNNDGNTMLAIKTGNTAISVTTRNNGSNICGQGYGCVPPSDVAVAQPANTVEVYGPFPQGRWNIPGFDTVRVDLTSTTQVSASAVRMPRQ